jgi:DNA-binding SARP family transcriptional activator
MAKLKKTPLLAKLTAPRLHNAIGRERLFAELDDARQHCQANWIVGPPGAGKTTLVASWLEDRRLRSVWYQVDSGDADIATLFYYLSLAAATFGPRTQPPLPLLTAEYLHDVPGFARRFFRELFSRLPSGGVLVLDNYQEVGSDNRFHALIAQAVEEMPEDKILVAISRTDPSPDYARLLANGALRVIGWEALKLNLDEATELVEARVRLSTEATRQLCEQSDGWAAGLTLLVESLRATQALSHARMFGREALFAYFAAQSFDQLSRSTREFLAATALLPQVPVSLAIRLTENPAAGDILEDLYRRHMFTHRREGSELIYWYHALFRDFLSSRLPELLGAQGALLARQHAARLLEERGDFHDAYEMHAATNDWLGAAALAEKCAERLLEQGRGQTLREWIAGLPPAEVAARPWLRYWVALSLIPLDPVDARAQLEAVLPLFSGEGDTIAMSLCAAAIIDTYFFEWATFAPVKQWVNQLVSLHRSLPGTTSPKVLRRVQTSLLIGMLYADPGHTLLPEIVRKVASMVEESKDANTTIAIGVALLTYCDLACDLRLGQWVVRRCEAAAASRELLPHNHLWWQLRLGYYLDLSGNYAQARAALDLAIEACERYGFRGLKGVFPLIASYQVVLSGSVGNADDLEHWTQRIAAALDPSRPLDVWLSDDARATAACMRGNFGLVEQICEAAADKMTTTGMAFVELLNLVNLGIARAVLSEGDAFRRTVAQLRSIAKGSCYAYFECSAAFLDAFYALLHDSADKARELVSTALRFARERSYSYLQTIRWARIVPEVFAYALRHGIEQEYVLETIKRLSVRAPANAPNNWPWPVQIFALGAFDIFSDGRKLNYSGKAPKKPLLLLKVLVAYGGRNVPEHRVMDALWPGEDADLAAKSLDVTLVRLRKLLGEHQAIVCKNEALSLNPNAVWSDVWAFEKLAASVLDHPGEAVADGIWQEALALYKGDLLPADAAASWSLKGRERLRSLFLRFVEYAGRRLEEQEAWLAAVSWYEKGLAADDLAEPFYQGLMRCYRALDRCAEAVSTYRKMRHLLSVVLGMAPSEASQALARQVQADQPTTP